PPGFASGIVPSSGCWGKLYLYHCLGAVYYLFTAYTERAFLQHTRLFKHPLSLNLASYKL
ncbi:hypothetical protein CBP28_03290, partial [Fischerella thermalis WC559]